MKNLQETLNVLLDTTHSKQKDLNKIELYKKLIQEEYTEFLAEPDKTPEQFKELCDLLWVCIQFANCCGYNLDLGMKKLIDEYRSKFIDKNGNFNPTYNKEGKLLKGNGFSKADFTSIYINRI